MNYKKIIILFVLMALVLPVLVFAKPSFCDRLSNLIDSTDKQMSNNKKKLSQKRVEISKKTSKKRKEYDKRCNQIREKWDTNREEHFNKLIEKVKTEEQKQAVVEFVITIREAISVRQEAVDRAISNYRNSLDSLKDSRKEHSDSLITNYKADINLVFIEARGECEGGANYGNVSNQVKTALKNFKDKFLKSKNNLKGSQKDVQELIATKKEVTKNAIGDFKTTLQGALFQFKEVIE